MPDGRLLLAQLYLNRRCLSSSTQLQDDSRPGPGLRTQQSATRLVLVSATSQAPRRKDAQRNREAILAAARALFAECADVPMCEVARRAGVGQATLYRNFPDRGDLAAALLLEEALDPRRAVEEGGVQVVGDLDVVGVYGPGSHESLLVRGQRSGQPATTMAIGHGRSGVVLRGPWV